MISNTGRTSGSLFVKHFIIGITSIVITVFAIKFLGVFESNKYTPLITAGFIALVNLITLSSFTINVINDEQLLAEDDSPDHAYYLGFCLTLASLAIIFFSDALQNVTAMSSDGTINLTKAAEIKSDLLRGALTQFAAGLLATLLGLSARIYLASKQNLSKQEPTELINQLRNEIFNFSSSLTESRKVHDDAITKSIKSLQSSLSKIENSAEYLASTFEDSAVSLNESLSSKEIGLQAKNFNEALKDLGSKTKNHSDEFIVNLKELTTNTSLLSENVGKTTVKLNEINDATGTFSKHLIKISNEDMPKISQSSISLIEGIKKAETSIQEASSMTTGRAIELSKSFAQVKISIDALNNDLKVTEIRQLRDDITKLSQNVSKLTTDITELSSKIKEQSKQDSGVISRWF